jgi:hypothetical protein
LIAIKVNIIDDLEIKINQYEAFEDALDNCDDSSSCCLRNCDLVMEDIKRKVFGRRLKNPNQVLDEQKKHLQAYLRQTKKANPKILPALIQSGRPVVDPRHHEGNEETVLQFAADYFSRQEEWVNEATILRFAAGYFSRHRSAKLAIRNFLYPKISPNADLQ